MSEYKWSFRAKVAIIIHSIIQNKTSEYQLRRIQRTVSAANYVFFKPLCRICTDRTFRLFSCNDVRGLRFKLRCDFRFKGLLMSKSTAQGRPVIYFILCPTPEYNEALVSISEKTMPIPFRSVYDLLLAAQLFGYSWARHVRTHFLAGVYDNSASSNWFFSWFLKPV